MDRTAACLEAVRAHRAAHEQLLRARAAGKYEAEAREIMRRAKRNLAEALKVTVTVTRSPVTE